MSIASVTLIRAKCISKLWDNMFGALKDKIGNMVPDTTAIKEKLSSKAEKIVFDNILPVASTALGKSEILAIHAMKSDQIVRVLSGKVYPKLPNFVKSIVTEEAFASFVLTHRATIVEKLQERVDRKASTATEISSVLMVEESKSSEGSTITSSTADRPMSEEDSSDVGEPPCQEGGELHQPTSLVTPTEDSECDSPNFTQGCLAPPNTEVSATETDNSPLTESQMR